MIVNKQTKVICYDDGKPVTYRTSPNQSGGFDPKFIVIHFTAGRLNINNPVNWLTNPKAKASAHLIIGRSSKELVQLVKLDRKSWHAGRSVWKHGWKTYKGLNKYAYGIELVNPGPLERRGDGNYYTRFGDLVPPEEVIIAAHKNGGPEKAWMAYTPYQLEKTYEVCEALIDYSPHLIDVLGHDDIAPKRKLDPGPAFPLEQLRTDLFGRENK